MYATNRTRSTTLSYPTLAQGIPPSRAKRLSELFDVHSGEFGNVVQLLLLGEVEKFVQSILMLVPRDFDVLLSAPTAG